MRKSISAGGWAKIACASGTARTKVLPAASRLIHATPAQSHPSTSTCATHSKGLPTFPRGHRPCAKRKESCDRPNGKPTEEVRKSLLALGRASACGLVRVGRRSLFPCPRRRQDSFRLAQGRWPREIGRAH